MRASTSATAAAAVSQERRRSIEERVHDARAGHLLTLTGKRRPTGLCRFLLPGIILLVIVVALYYLEQGKRHRSPLPLSHSRSTTNANVLYSSSYDAAEV